MPRSRLERLAFCLSNKVTRQTRYHYANAAAVFVLSVAPHSDHVTKKTLYFIPARDSPRHRSVLDQYRGRQTISLHFRLTSIHLQSGMFAKIIQEGNKAVAAVECHDAVQTQERGWRLRMPKSSRHFTSLTRVTRRLVFHCR